MTERSIKIGGVRMAVGGIKGMIYRQAGKMVNSFVRKADTESFSKLLFTVGALSKEPAKSGLKKLGLMAKEGHPMIKKWIEIFQMFG